MEIKRLNEMAVRRTDAILTCMGLGKQFIRHFDKIYHDPKSVDTVHWSLEMLTWYTDASAITLKAHKSHRITAENLEDWFFKICSEVEIVMDDCTAEEQEAYKQFYKDVLSMGVIEALKKSFPGIRVAEK